MNKKLVVFAPHPDDETLGCGGTIAKRISEGWEVLIVIMTDGRYAFHKVLDIDSAPTPEQMKEIRRKEVKKATRILGVPENNLLFLDFVDGTLESNIREAEEKVVKILSETLPDEIYFPCRRDVHPDHKAVYKIVKNAITRLRISPACYQYLITHRFARFHRFIDVFLDFFLGYKKIYVDISEFLHIKKRAIMEFKSQVTIILAEQRKIIVNNVEEFKRSKEVFYVEKTP